MSSAQDGLSRLQPVIIGSDVGTYAWARAFHEAYGVRSIVVSNQPRGPVSYSNILDLHLVGADPTPERKMEILRRIAREHPDSQLILVVNAEHDVELIDHNWDELNELYIVPTTLPSNLAVLQDKDRLAQLCHQLGIRTPRSVPVTAQHRQLEAIAELDFPLIVKPARSGEYSQMSFPGQRKVYLTNSQSELTAVCDQIFNAGYTGELVVQEFIPGNEQANLNVTAYRDQHGKITVAFSSQMMLGHQTSALLGVAVAMLPRPYPELEEQVIRLLEATNYRGFANVDFKVHARTGTPVLLDFNPRVGRSLHQLLTAGINPAVAIVNDWVEGGKSEQLIPHYEGVYSLVPRFWVQRYIADPAVAKQFARQWRHGHVHPHPLVYSQDRTWKKTFYRYASSVNAIRRFLSVYPRPTESGFAENVNPT